MPDRGTRTCEAHHDSPRRQRVVSPRNMRLRHQVVHHLSPAADSVLGYQASSQRQGRREVTLLCHVQRKSSPRQQRKGRTAERVGRVPPAPRQGSRLQVLPCRLIAHTYTLSPTNPHMDTTSTNMGGVNDEAYKRRPSPAVKTGPQRDTSADRQAPDNAPESTPTRVARPHEGQRDCQSLREVLHSSE